MVGHMLHTYSNNIENEVDLGKDILNQGDLGDNSNDGMDGSLDALSILSNSPNGLHEKDMEGQAREGVIEASGWEKRSVLTALQTPNFAVIIVLNRSLVTWNVSNI
ncbi:MAG: hypothetical protein WBZ36_18995 [Candidatus Nitrosopolaris sp.]